MKTYCDLPDVTQWLSYNPELIDPKYYTGLMFFANVLDMDAVGYNSCCLHVNGDFDDLLHCSDFFAAFSWVLVVIADAKKRTEIKEKLRQYITATPLLVANDSVFRGCKSVRQLISKFGLSAADGLLLDVTEVPVYGLLNLSDVRQPPKAPTTKSGISQLDRTIGGFADGELSVWTGRRGDGKSTLLSQLCLDAIDQDRNVCVYTGELPAWRFKNWISLQAAGADNVQKLVDEETWHEYYTVPKDIKDKLDSWWDKKLFLYDLEISSAHDPKSILDIFGFAYRRYGCKMFIVDNLMTARLDSLNDRDYYRAQSTFTGQLIEFAKHTGTHVHLVAHPRKDDEKSSLTASAVSGTGDIVNRADNAFALERLTETKATEAGYNAVLTVLKNRAYGAAPKIGLCFDETCRRYRCRDQAPNKKYGWEATDAEWQPVNDPTPFDKK